MDTHELFDVAGTARKFLGLEHSDYTPVAILAGAGISIPAPSCLPSGRELTEALIEAATDARARRELRLLADASRSDARSESDFLRFEGLLQILRDHADPDLRSLQRLREANTPNSFHKLLASRLRLGDTVLTTNFDRLIEVALLEIKCDFRLVATDEDFAAIGAEMQRVQMADRARGTLFKLHGSFYDRKGDEASYSIKATLDSLLRGHGAVGMEPNKFEVLRRILEERHLIVVGYSGYDDFDILPSLLRIGSRRRVLWIDHVEGDSVPTKTESLLPPSDSNRLTQTHWRSIEIVERLRRNAAAEVLFIRGESYAILEAILQSSSDDAPQPRKLAAPLPPDFVVDERLKPFITARLFDEAQRYEEALKYYHEYERLLPPDLAHQKGEALLYIAMTEYRLQRSRRWVPDIRRPIELLSQAVPDRRLARAFQWAGTIAQSLGGLFPVTPALVQKIVEIAFDFYTKAEDIAERVGDQVTVAQCRSQRGMSLFDSFHT